MQLLGFLGRRGFQAIFVLFGLSILIFFIARLVLIGQEGFHMREHPGDLAQLRAVENGHSPPLAPDGRLA